MTKKSDELLNTISTIRTVNNLLWMEILKLAFDSRPKKVRNVIKQIKENDKEIAECLGKL